MREIVGVRRSAESVGGTLGGPRARRPPSSGFFFGMALQNTGLEIRLTLA